MQNPTYLTCSRHSIYYFRYPLPKSLHEPGKARDFKFSLRTKDSRKALHLSRLLVYLADFLIKQGVMQGMKYVEIQAVLKKHFSMRLNTLRKRISDQGLLPESTVKNFHWNRDLGPYLVESREEVLAPLIERYDMPIEIGSKAFDMLGDEYEKWHYEFKTKAMRLNDEYGKIEFNEASSEVVETTYSQEDSADLSELIQAFITEHLRGESWSLNTEKSYLQMLSLLSRILGEKKLCTEITRKDCRRVKEILSKLPVGHSVKKKTKGKTIQEIVKLDLEPKLSVKTINKHLVTYSSLFKWGVTNDYVATNYFEGLSLKQANKNKPSREAFSQNEAQLILKELINNEKNLVRKKYQKWGALIGLFTGARLNEVAQLTVDDIKEIDGILCFDINDNGDRKQLKNAASERIVPIHSKLLELGLLDYVKAVKNIGRERLLYELTYDANNKYGRNLGRWFNTRFLVELGLKRKQLVFHSLCHTMVTELLRSGVETPLAKAVVGHAQEGVTLQTYFDRGYRIAQLSEAIEQVHTQEG